MDARANSTESVHNVTGSSQHDSVEQVQARNPMSVASIVSAPLLQDSKLTLQFIAALRNGGLQLPSTSQDVEGWPLNLIFADGFFGDITSSQSVLISETNYPRIVDATDSLPPDRAISTNVDPYYLLTRIVTLFQTICIGKTQQLIPPSSFCTPWCIKFHKLLSLAFLRVAPCPSGLYGRRFLTSLWSIVRIEI